MKPIPDQLVKKLEIISNEVKDDLRKKGIIIPVENDDGSISLGNYRIVKTNDFYAIVDYAGYPIVENINLPQTAALLANNLALGKFIDTILVDTDRKYGYALFEENLYRRNLQKKRKRNSEYLEVTGTKCIIAKAKKDRYKQGIVQSFEKLRKFI